MKRAFVALMLLVTAACGRPSGPVAVPTEEIPFPLSRSVEPSDPAASTARVPIYFARRGRLVMVLRTIARDSESVIRSLLDGPTQRETDRGIRSEIPAATRLLGVALDGMTAHVDMSSELQGPASSESIVLRVAQVVFSLGRLPEVRSIAFQIDGEPVGVVLPDGSSVERPVTPDDYRSLAPPA